MGICVKEARQEAKGASCAAGERARANDSETCSGFQRGKHAAQVVISQHQRERSRSLGGHSPGRSSVLALALRLSKRNKGGGKPLLVERSWNPSSTAYCERSPAKDGVPVQRTGHSPFAPAPFYWVELAVF